MLPNVEKPVETAPPVTTPSIEEQKKAAEDEWREGWKRGPVRLHWDKKPIQPGDPAPDLELKASTGETLKLSKLWSERPLAIVFWRHFGCSCGVDRAKRLKTEYSEYLSAGGQVVLIGQGEPERAAEYAKKHELPCTMLCSPDLSAYIAFDLLEGSPAQILFDAPDELLQRDHGAGMKFADDRKADNRPPVDSPWQLPGEFVIDKKGTIRLAYRYNFCEDWPDHRVLVSAIKEAIWHP